MMVLSILYGQKYAETQVGTVTFDSAVSETHRFSSTVTQYPVENGTIVSDHILKKPDSIILSGVVTDSPLNIFSFYNRSIDAFNRLVQLHEKREVFTVVTGIKIYNNMTITSLNVPRALKTGQSLKFDIELQRIIYSSNPQYNNQVTNVFGGVSDNIPRDSVASNANIPVLQYDPPNSLKDQAESPLNMGVQSLIATPTATISNVLSFIYLIKRYTQ
jgi:hypothetical protein